MSIKLLAEYYRKKGSLKWSFSDREGKKKKQNLKTTSVLIEEYGHKESCKRILNLTMTILGQYGDYLPTI